jgi:hypothetical protein
MVMTSDDLLESQILEYLQDHRRAGDTLEGIAQWWLLCHRVDRTVPLVKQTLEILKDKGMIIEHQLPDGGCLYLPNEPGVHGSTEVSAGATFSRRSRQGSERRAGH